MTPDDRLAYLWALLHPANITQTIRNISTFFISTLHHQKWGDMLKTASSNADRIITLTFANFLVYSNQDKKDSHHLKVYALDIFP